jgi:hypothetical protein
MWVVGEGLRPSSTGSTAQHENGSMISTVYCKSYLIKAQQEGASRCAPTEITTLIVAQKFYGDGSSFITKWGKTDSRQMLKHPATDFR